MSSTRKGSICESWVRQVKLRGHELPIVPLHRESHEQREGSIGVVRADSVQAQNAFPPLVG